jgi:hypothetical protein
MYRTHATFHIDRTALDCAIDVGRFASTEVVMRKGQMRRIRPWVGRKYDEGVGGKRVLLLGESNYDPSPEPTAQDPNILLDNVKHCVFEGSVPFFTKAAKLVLMASGSTRISRDDIRDLWTRVAFSNYVQRILRRARERPSPEDWDLGREALSDLIADRRPEVIVAMGLHLASNLDWLSSAAPSVTVVPVAHPSSFGFAYAKWVGKVKRVFLPRAA